MTVKELIEKLKEFDPEEEVFLEDSEFGDHYTKEVVEEQGFIYIR